MPGTIIVDNANIRIDHWRAGRQPADRLAFTFMERQRTPAQFAATRDGNGFGGDLLLRNDFDVICFKPTRSDWYQSVGDADLDAVNAYVDGLGRDHLLRVGYGSSMGAYAAIQFAAPLGLDRVLSLSPLIDFSGWDTRFSGDLSAVPMHWTIDAATVSRVCVHYCVYDPLNDDRRHMALLAKMLPASKVVHITLPMSGHPSMTFMAQTGLLKDTCLRVLRDGDAPDTAAYFQRRRISAHWHFTLAQLCLARRKYRCGLRAIDAAIRLAPEKAHLHAYRVRLLVRSGRDRAALGAARQILDRFPDEAWVRSELAKLLRQKKPASPLPETRTWPPSPKSSPTTPLGNRFLSSPTRSGIMPNAR